MNEHDYLPSGVHVATLDKVIARFGHGNEQREAEGHSLTWLAPIAKRAGVTKLLIDGSFVTDRIEPNDVDCALLVPNDYDESTPAAEQLLDGLPSLDLKVVNAEDYEFAATVLFGADRVMMPKGVIEVVL